MKLTEAVRAELNRAAAATDIDLAQEKLVVGVSGGPDSLVLLHLLAQTLQREQLIVAHLDHGLRPSSAAEAQRLAATAFGLCFFTERTDVAELARGRRLSLEEAGRIARYNFLARVAQSVGAPAVVVGHNADDQAETVLMHLLRGSGLTGLQGMRPVSRLPVAPDLWLWRPLIHVTREEIELYVAEHGLEPVRDESNTDPGFLRNRLRHELLPTLERYNPQVRRRLAEMADLVAADEVTLQAMTDEAWRNVVMAESESRVKLRREDWRDLPLALRRRVLRRAIATVQPELRDVGFSTLEAARQIAERKPAGSLRADLPGGVALLAGYDSIVMFTEQHEESGYPQLPAAGQHYVLTVPGVVALAEGWQITSEWVETWREEDVRHNRDPWTAFITHPSGTPLIVRGRRPGERMRPLGLGGEKKLKEIMIDRKIPVDLRRRWPIVTNNEHALWVTGHVLDDRAQVMPVNEQGVVRLRCRPDDSEGG